MKAPRELGDLVVALDLDPAVHLGPRDRPSGVAQLAQRRQHPAGDREGEHRAQEQDGDGHRGDDLHGLVDLLALVGGEHGDGERAERPRLALDRDRHVAGRAAGRVDLASLDLLEGPPSFDEVTEAVALGVVAPVAPRDPRRGR